MSVDYRAGLIYGWKITKEEYESLNEDIKSYYAINTDMICGTGQYFVGDIQRETSNKEVHQIYSDVPEIADGIYDIIKKALPDLIDRLPNPTLYLYCRVF